LKIIGNISQKDIIEIFEDTLVITELKILICGNVTLLDAREISKMFVPLVKYKYMPTLIDKDIATQNISPNLTIIKESDTQYEDNVAVGYYIELFKIKVGTTPDWAKKLCLISILENIISDKYFDALRTNEEFGYIVNGKSCNIGDPVFTSWFYKFLVQSPNKTIPQIIERTLLFITEFEKYIETLTDDTIAEYINGCSSTLKYPFVNLSELSTYLFSQLEYEYYNFDMKQILLREYEKLTRADIIATYRQIFINTRKSIVVCLERSKSN
jgi:insulysin